MDKKILKLIAENWIAAFGEHDIEKLLSLYHPHAKHYSPRIEIERPQTKGWLKGKDQLKSWWQNSFSTLPDLNYSLRNLTVEDDRVFITYIRKVSGQHTQEVMEYLLIKNGLIIESRVLRSWII